MSIKYHIRERIFLNKFTEMRAYVIATVEDTRDLADCFEDGWRHGHIELRIADCYEEISLSFDLSGRAERENSLQKIGKLAEVINAFKTALEIEAESIEDREAVIPLYKAMTATIQ